MGDFKTKAEANHDRHVTEKYAREGQNANEKGS